MEKILDRFLRYVAVDTQSDPTSESQPSAAKELDLLKMLKDELLAMGVEATLDEYGYLVAENGKTEFDHIPSWYEWQRQEVRRELEDGSYKLDVPVDIIMTVDTYGLYHVGEGRLTHTKDGFKLVGCDGKLSYEQKPLASYSLYSDFNWYEVGDVISIGNADAQYYCFPKTERDIVAKTRLATEELYKIVKNQM